MISVPKDLGFHDGEDSSVTDLTRASASSDCPQLDALTVESTMIPALRAQIAAIWPQERELVARYRVPAQPKILDVGCGTGELEIKLAELWPTSVVIGLDIAPKLVEIARRRAVGHANVEFFCASGADIPFADAMFDVVFCRHVLQAITNPEGVIAEMVRVLRPGGVLHFVSEDYGMIYDSNGASDTDRLWRDGWVDAGQSCGIDLRIGRKLPAMLKRRGLCDVRVNFAIVDTLQVERKTLQQMFLCWRIFADDWAFKHSRTPRSDLIPLFDAFLATLEDPDAYVLWQVPIVSAVKPH